MAKVFEFEIKSKRRCDPLSCNLSAARSEYKMVGADFSLRYYPASKQIRGKPVFFLPDEHGAWLRNLKIAPTD